jgi:hypothetical protein
MILNVGGNVFKDAKGQPLTSRISRENVVPTVQWLEQLTGLNLQDNMLGTTGRAETSGDLDLGVDATKISKDVLIKHLLKRGVSDKDIRKSGDAVHLKTPILGDSNNGYVQTDFMFTENPSWQHFALTGGAEGSQFKGLHRHILLSSIAKAQNMKWSPKSGLIDRATDEVISTDPDDIARTLLGGQANRGSITSVEKILDALEGNPDADAILADARETLGREGVTI